MGQGYPRWCTDMSEQKPMCREKVPPVLPICRLWLLRKPLGFIFFRRWIKNVWNMFFYLPECSISIDSVADPLFLMSNFALGALFPISPPMALSTLLLETATIYIP
jgi:hypothetical protein